MFTRTAFAATALDPFAYWPDRASVVAGLGGPDPSEDPAYGFHTPYVEIVPGATAARLQFDGLAASSGSMILRVNALRDEGDPHAEVIRSWPVDLADLARRGGSMDLPFKALPDHRYAVLGHVYSGTDASADGLSITLDSPLLERDFGEDLRKSRSTVFGRSFFRRASKLLDPGIATLADPVSQTCTASQFDEPSYDQWIDRLHMAKHRHRKQWEFIYILRVLEQRGMLRPGMRGVGFGVGIEPLPAAMAANGCEIVATDLPADDVRSRDWTLTNQHSASRDHLRYPAICPAETFDARVGYRPADMNDIPADLTGFDFTWSSCSYEHLGSIEAGLDFVRNSLNCLKQGGIAVHTTELNLTSNDATIDNQGTVLFRRRDIEKLAADLTSRGHIVAPIKYDLGHTHADDYVDLPPYSGDIHLKLALGRFVTTSFGIVVQKS